jgi:Short C-terminal domain
MIVIAAIDIGALLATLGALIVILVASALAWKWWRTRIFGVDSAASFEGTLEELRKLRDAGELTRDEFEAARARVMAKLKDQVEIPEAVRAMRERRQGGPASYPQPDSPRTKTQKPTTDSNDADSGPARR